MTKVSVITLAYNSAPYIADTIRGVVRQKTNFTVQHIISDDCSTDGTWEICQEWQRQHPHIVEPVRNERNVGLQANFMRAYAKCRGEYVALCDGDDYWCDHRKLQMMVDYMDAHRECAVAFHRVINYFEDKGTKSLSNGGQKQIMQLSDLARSNTITNCSVLYRRANVPELPEWIGEIKLCDYAMHILNACHGYIRYFKRPMAVYRQRSSAEWSLQNFTDREKKLNMALDVRKRLIDHLPAEQNAARELIRDAFTRFALAEVAFSRAHGLDDAAERLARRVMEVQPTWMQDQLEQALARTANAARPTLGSHVMRWMKAARAAVSWFVPLPKP